MTTPNRRLAETPADVFIMITTTTTKQLDQIADVFSGHYERGAGDDDPAGTHRLVLIASIDPTSHALLRERCPRFTPTKAPRQAVLQHGDVVIPARGNRVSVALIGDTPDRRPLVAASFLHVVRPQPAAVEPAYLAWWFSSRQGQAQIRERGRGTKISFLPLRAARSLEIPLPPLDVQRRIAEIHQLADRESQIMDNVRRLRRDLSHALLHRIATGVHGEDAAGRGVEPC